MRRNIVDCISVRGYAHELNGLECQDFSCCWQSRTYDAVAVSDGHGGEKYIRSAKGSRFACEAAKRAIEGFMDHLADDATFYRQFVKKESETRDTALKQLKSAIIQGWNELVAHDLQQNALQNDTRYAALRPEDVSSLDKTPEKAYGATLIAAIVTDRFYLVLKLGDGNVCLCNKKHAELVESPSLQEDRLQFNQTTSLCNSDALSSFKHGFFLSKKAAKMRGLTVTTDGILNCYAQKEPYLDFIANIITGYHDQSFQTARNELAEFLPRLSAKGSGDDLSVALIVRAKYRAV